MNHLNEIKLLFIRELQNSYYYPPPFFFFEAGDSAASETSELLVLTQSSASKCFLISLAVAFFVLSGNVYAQTTCANHMPGDPPSDRDVLIDLYCATITRGALWRNSTNWLSDSAFNSWYGVTATGDTVTRIILPLNNLIGTIPSELEDLGSLEQLNLRANELTGTILSELGNLSHLTHLNLYVNKLSGTIPSELGGLSSLQELHLYDNELTGTIPSELEELGRLGELYLHQNQLSGTIPSELGT